MFITKQTALRPCGRERERAAHALSEAARNREPKPSAFMAARGARIGLFEILEDRGAPVLRHAGARIRYVEYEALAFCAQAQAHAARLRELQGVAGEIKQNLAHARAIAHDADGNPGRQEGRDLKSARLRARRQQFRHALHERARRKGRADHLQPPRLDAREIENLVHQSDERLRAAAHGLHIGALLILQTSKREQIGKADHGGEGRSQFMADDGEKARLGFVARLRGAHVAQSLAQAFVLGAQKRQILLRRIHDANRFAAMATAWTLVAAKAMGARAA